MNCLTLSVRAFILMIVLSSLAIACKPKPGSGGILDINEMKLLMWDMAVVDEFNTTYLGKDSVYRGKQDSATLLRIDFNKKYQEVFALHKTDQKTFFDSYDFYRSHPKYYKQLIDSLAAFGNRERESRFMRTRTSPQPVKLQKDSMRPVAIDTFAE